MIKVYKSIDSEIRKNAIYDERWGNIEAGLITAWESGRVNRDRIFKDIIPLIGKGALPKLSFKGGHKIPLKILSYKVGKTSLILIWDKKRYKDFFKPKYKFKHGTFNYLAQLQGLLGQDLDIEIQDEQELELVCKSTGLKTILTTDQDKYKYK